MINGTDPTVKDEMELGGTVMSCVPEGEVEHGHWILLYDWRVELPSQELM